ncbi:MAG: ABC transporter permease, partial [Bacillota bacterium]|nr:ABC transporter permease [Bacillota bacterium]
MGKAYLKSVFRTIKGNLSRFIFVTSIIAVGVAFVTGVGGISSKVTDSLSEYLEEKNVPDVIMKYGNDETEESEAIKGFVDEDRDYYQELLNSYSGIGSSISLFQMDMELDDLETRLYAYPLGSSINPIDVVTGEYPTSYDEILIEEPVDAMTQYQIGDTIEIDLSYFLGDYAPMFPDLLKFEFKVVGYAKNPLMFLKTADFSQVSQDENGDYLQLDRIIYTDLDLMESEIETRFEEATYGMMKGYIPRTDIYLCLNRVESEYFTDAYKDEIDERIDGIKDLGGVYESSVSYLSLEENASYLSVREIVEKVDTLASIFPMFFVAVVGLVVLTTCSRMVDEERPMLGCYKSLGYGDMRIIGKYLLFVIAAGLIGAVIGIFLGMYTLPIIIYPAFEQGMFYMPAMTSKVDFLTGLYSAIGILGAALLVSYGVAKY